jgi:C-terminal processing protease CtpA/Prc
MAGAVNRMRISLIALTLLIFGIRLSEPRADASSGADSVRSRMLDICNQVADIVKQNYYDPTLKGLDWKAAVEVARERIRHADHEGEMTAAISGLLARLNDSHTYFLRPFRSQPVIFGFKAKAFGEEVRIYEIMPRGPADEAGLQLGDHVIGVEGFAANRQLIDDEMRYFQYLDPQSTTNLKILRDDGPPKDYVIKSQTALHLFQGFRENVGTIPRFRIERGARSETERSR